MISSMISNSDMLELGLQFHVTFWLHWGPHSVGQTLRQVKGEPVVALWCACRFNCPDSSMNCATLLLMIFDMIWFDIWWPFRFRLFTALAWLMLAKQQKISDSDSDYQWQKLRIRLGLKIPIGTAYNYSWFFFPAWLRSCHRMRLKLGSVMVLLDFVEDIFGRLSAVAVAGWQK